MRFFNTYSNPTPEKEERVPAYTTWSNTHMDSYPYRAPFRIDSGGKGNSYYDRFADQTPQHLDELERKLNAPDECDLSSFVNSKKKIKDVLPSDLDLMLALSNR